MNETLYARQRATTKTPLSWGTASTLVGVGLATLGTVHLLATLTGRENDTPAHALALLGLGFLAVYIGYKKSESAGGARPAPRLRRVRSLARPPARRPRFVRMAHEVGGAK